MDGFLEYMWAGASSDKCECLVVDLISNARRRMPLSGTTRQFSPLARATVMAGPSAVRTSAKHARAKM